MAYGTWNNPVRKHKLWNSLTDVPDELWDSCKRCGLNTLLASSNYLCVGCWDIETNKIKKEEILKL